MRGVQIKDVASSFTSEPGVLTINVDHIRFKSAPSADGDGYRMETPLDQIPREPEARRMGGTLGGLWTPYFIELPRRRFEDVVVVRFGEKYRQVSTRLLFLRHLSLCRLDLDSRRVSAPARVHHALATKPPASKAGRDGGKGRREGGEEGGGSGGGKERMRMLPERKACADAHVYAVGRARH